MAIMEWFGAKPTKQSFATRLLAVVGKESRGNWSYKEEENAIHNAAGATINLGNIYLEYAAAKLQDRNFLLTKHASMARSIDESPPGLWVVAAKNVYPVIRSTYSYLMPQIDQRDGDGPFPLPTTLPFVGDLEIRLVYDYGEHIAHIKDELVETWGQSREAVLQRALGNLSALEFPRWELVGHGVHRLHSDVSYGETMLLLDPVVQALGIAEPVFVACNRGFLLAADRTSDAAVAAMAKLGHELYLSDPWPLSATFCTRVDGAWREFTPTGEAGPPARDFQRCALASLYEDQKSALENLHGRTGEDIFVATFGMLQRPGRDEVESWSSWAEGVITLLPVTDLVAFGKDPDSPGGRNAPMLAWDDAVRICGARMKLTDEDPTRYLVDSFPDEEEWVRIVADGDRRAGLSLSGRC